MRTKYRVKVSSYRHRRTRRWTWRCPACPEAKATSHLTRTRAMYVAARHAATCEALHWANWEAACPSCKLYGVIAKACPVCLGRGHVVEREGLE